MATSLARQRTVANNDHLSDDMIVISSTVSASELIISVENIKVNEIRRIKTPEKSNYSTRIKEYQTHAFSVKSGIVIDPRQSLQSYTSIEVTKNWFSRDELEPTT